MPLEPPGGVTAGIDWASTVHVACVVDGRGQVTTRFTVEHTTAGLAELVTGLRRAGTSEIAIERSDGPLVEALLAAGLTVVVISPNQLKNLRSRYGSAGNKDDRFDAYVLADTLRTDRARLRPLAPDSPATQTLRATVRARRDLVTHRVALANQLRAHLQRVFPGAVGLFRDLDSPISLAFLARFDCQNRADWLTPRRLAAWLASVGYSGRKDPAVLLEHLRAAPRGATGEHSTAAAHTTRALLAVHPRPRLALRDLALLARPHRLRPRPPRSPPTPSQRRSTSGGLIQGYSCDDVRTPRRAGSPDPAPGQVCTAPLATTVVGVAGRERPGSSEIA
jgi:transposase